MKWLLAASLLTLTACGTRNEEESSATAESPLIGSGDAVRYQWARYVHTTVAPRLRRLPVGIRPSDEAMKNVVLWGIGEGIYTVSANGGYGQHGMPQSPLSYSNCLDSVAYNAVSALPACPSLRSGNWQVGIAGLQVGEYLSRLPGLYRTLYGEMPPAQLGRLLLSWMNEDEYQFPNLSIDALGDPANAKWASVVMRDPAIGVLAMTSHPWMQYGIPASYPFYRRGDIVDTVWNEGPPPSSVSPNGSWVIDGMARAFYGGPTPFDGGAPFFACSNAAVDPCLATFGWAIGPMNGTTQPFERSVVQLGYDATGKEHATLDRRIADAHPDLPPITSHDAVDPAFRAYFEAYGGLEVFGWPIAPVRAVGDRWVQDFERVELSRPMHASFDTNAHDPAWQVSRATP